MASTGWRTVVSFGSVCRARACADGYVNPLMSWLDSESAGYMGWAWNADFNCSSGPG
jgi:hypothetical protein